MKWQLSDRPRSVPLSSLTSLTSPHLQTESTSTSQSTATRHRSAKTVHRGSEGGPTNSPQKELNSQILGPRLRGQCTMSGSWAILKNACYCWRWELLASIAGALLNLLMCRTCLTMKDLMVTREDMATNAYCFYIHEPSRCKTLSACLG
jgi:hypothetical protein